MTRGFREDLRAWTDGSKEVMALEQHAQNARLQGYQYEVQLQRLQSLQEDQEDRAQQQVQRIRRQRVKPLGLSRDSHETYNSRKSSNSLDLKMDHSDKPTGPVDVGSYTQPFLSFISENPTVFHAVASVAKRLESYGFTKLSERDSWTSKLTRGGNYFFERNGSSLVAFVVGKEYKSGNGASVIASHIDALTTRLKPIPTLSTKAGYVQLGVAPYAGALNNTWWDRDLGIGGRVLVKNGETGKIETKLVKLGWPIARIPTLAPHFGAADNLSNPNKETEMVPIIGLDSAESRNGASQEQQISSVLGGAGTFTATQPERLVKAIAGEMNIQDCESLQIPTLRKTNNAQTVQSSTGSSNFSIPNPHNWVD